MLAGAAGIEPANDGIKSRCLTTWRRPNNILCGAEHKAYCAPPQGPAFSLFVCLKITILCNLY